MISSDDFTQVTLESKPLFDKHYKKYPPIHSDNVFATMVAWNEYAHYEYVFFDDTLILKVTVDGIVQFRPPIGRFNKETFDILMKLAKKDGSEYPISLITDDVKEWIEKNYNSISFAALPEYADYVYRCKDLASLEGSDYRKIRNRLNKFVKNFKYETETISEGNISEVKQFLKRWCIWRECEDDPLLSYEKKAVMFSTDHFTELGLSGIAIRVNDHIEAISIFEQMSPDTVVVHFEKGSPHYDGIYKVVNMETARIVEGDVAFINRESDMGNPGLRKAKKSYRPHHMIQVYKMENVTN